MRRSEPVSGEFYRHFKGKLYQVLTVAKDSGTGKEQVVYQALYPPYEKWVRELSEFMGPVDRKIYPDAQQQNRFELVAPDCFGETVSQAEPEKEKKELALVTDAELEKALKTGQPERYLAGRIEGDEIARRGFLLLLDAGTFREKRQIFLGLKQYLDARLLGNIAVALDIVLEDGDTQQQYESILSCLDKFEHYEGGRLR
ncbi:MAG: DUF1653 domain-containing protein [Clostridiaceae bacterium]|nr:DUF1653 domain-containing protein [Clostridiaceae bacterium]